MGFGDFFSSSTPQVENYFEERAWDTEAGDGEHLGGHGHLLRDHEERVSAWSDDVLASAGVLIFKVADITRHRSDAQADGFAAGSPVVLVRDDGNHDDPSAIEIRDASRKCVAGYVPKEVAAALAPRFDRREELEALVLWESRDESGERCDLRILVAPPAVLAERPRSPKI